MCDKVYGFVDGNCGLVSGLCPETLLEELKELGLVGKCNVSCPYDGCCDRIAVRIPQRHNVVTPGMVKAM